MKPIAEPVSPELISHEMSERAPLASFRGLSVMTFAGPECPHSLREIGRLRELAFRQAGAGRGQQVDLDHLDTCDNGYCQLAAWDPERQEFAGMLRYQLGARALAGGTLKLLRTAGLFRYSDAFRTDTLPHALELGRSVVNTAAARSRFALFGLWCGLARLVPLHGLETFFGNGSLYLNLGERAIHSLVAHLEALYPAKGEPPLVAHEGLRFVPDEASATEANKTLREGLAGNDVPSRVAFFRTLMARFNQKLPPILQSYIGLGQAITFGQCAEDADFGGALEIGIVVPTNQIDPEAAKRFGL